MRNRRPHYLIPDTGRTNSGFLARCSCGAERRHSERAKARALIYAHIITVTERPCPTPGKKAHNTREQAENAITKFLRTPRPGTRPTRVYLCPSGKHWHTTKTTSTLSKKAEAA